MLPNLRQSAWQAAGPICLALSLVSLAPVREAVAETSTQSQISEVIPFDRAFIDMMVPHHQGAVAMAQIAQKRAQHKQVRLLANDVIAGQDREIRQMKAWRKAWYGSAATPSMDTMSTLPGASMSTMGMMTDIRHLRTAKPFDKAFLDAMLPHHRSAVQAATLELRRGSHAQLKNLARGIIAAQRLEIREMQSWRKAWYGSSGMSGMGH